MADMKFGILTISDTCYEDPKKDTSGPNLKEAISKHYPTSKITIQKIVPDEIDIIKSVLIKWCDEKICNVILTTGGTGFAKRDVTPEATRQVIEKEAPGLSYAMISKSLAITHMAMLSRAICGIRSQTLILNLPGSRKGAAECFDFVKDAIPHAIALLTDQKEQVALLHETIQNKEAGDGAVHVPSKVKLNVACRSRKSPYPLIEVEEAFKIIIDQCSFPEEFEIISFDQSINRILAEDVYALEPVPPFRASIKDGYAVIAEDGAGKRNIKEVAAAGDAPINKELKKGEAVRISTGAPLPLGSNAVVQVEDTTIVKASNDGSAELIINIDVMPKVNQEIREIGSDVPLNSLVLNKYDQIKPAHVGVLAMLGKTKVKVFKRASVGVISTGNEIGDPKEILKPGKIRDANKFTLIHLLRKYNYDPVDCGIARDDPDSVKSTLEKAFRNNDVVVTSGGVSMGEFDVLKQVLIEDFNAKIHFARVNMKPGKPTTLATLIYKERTKIFFGLPGNPVSCGVTCLLYVVPALKYMEHNSKYTFPIIQVRGPELVNNDTRPEYHRVQVYVDSSSGTLKMSSTGNQISSRLNSLVGANGLAIVKGNTKMDVYNVILFDNLL